MWAREKVVRVEDRPEYGGMHLVGVVETRHCGCSAQLGMRLDLNETTFGVCPCPEHGVHAARALDVMKHMPPQDAEIFGLWRDLLEAELSVAA